MSLNIERKKTLRRWYWFLGLYTCSLVGYGGILVLLHYINVLLVGHVSTH